jgi:nitrogenase-associated protein
MATITFFEKTGCVNNTKQKQILQLSGHIVTPINLISYDWTIEELEEIFKDTMPESCFNLNAPQITSGEINPKSYTKSEALQALLNEHILIKRPILKINDSYIVGFNTDKLDELFDISTTPNLQVQTLLKDDLDNCPHKKSGGVCD